MAPFFWLNRRLRLPLRAAWEHQGICFYYHSQDPEPAAVEPEDRDLLQLAGQLDRFVLLHDHGDAAFAVRPVRRAGVHIHELVAAAGKTFLEIPPSALVFFLRKILAARIKGRQDRERITKTRGFEAIQCIG